MQTELWYQLMAGDDEDDDKEDTDDDTDEDGDW